LYVARTENHEARIISGNAHAPYACCVLARHVDAAGAALLNSLKSVPWSCDAPTPRRTAAQPRRACPRSHDLGDAAGPGLSGGAPSRREL
jgi:hypothetical protein